MPAPHHLRASFSAKGPWHETWIVVTLVCVLMLVELVMRSQASRLSGNIQHIGQFPAIAATLAQQPASILFLGNSLTNNGIDPALFRNLPSGPRADVVEKIVPDATSLSDWFCIFSNNIAGLDRPPRVLVLGFAWLQLSDQYPINASRLGGYFCSLADIPSLSATALADHNNLLDFLAGAGSHVYLNREAIRNRLLDTLVPNYRAISQSINVNPGLSSGKNTQIEYTYVTLTRFSQMARDTGVKLVLVAMPVKDKYPIEPALAEAVRNDGVTLLDMRDTPGLTNDMFLDPIHLNEPGRHRFSLALAQALPAAIDDRGTGIVLRGRLAASPGPR